MCYVYGGFNGFVVLDRGLTWSSVMSQSPETAVEAKEDIRGELILQKSLAFFE